MGQIIFGTLTVLKNDRRSDRYRRNRQNGKDRPFRTGHFRIDAQKAKIVEILKNYGMAEEKAGECAEEIMQAGRPQRPQRPPKAPKPPKAEAPAAK